MNVYTLGNMIDILQAISWQKKAYFLIYFNILSVA